MLTTHAIRSKVTHQWYISGSKENLEKELSRFPDGEIIPFEVFWPETIVRLGRGTNAKS